MTFRRSQRGFTLIELMIVVGIVGVIASVAIPSFGRFAMRARAAERKLVLRAIKKAVEDSYVRAGRLEIGGIPTVFVWGAPNPAAPPTTFKRPFNRALPGWDILAEVGEIEGQLYYQYQYWAMDWPGAQWMFEQASGDLDGDGLQSQKQIWWLRDSAAGIYVTHPEWGWVWPQDGDEDNLTF